MGATMTLEVSDGIREVSRLLADYEHEPQVLQPEDARTLRACLDLLYRSARALENEVSCARWNRAAREEQIDSIGRVLAETCRPETNVVLFPVAPRPFGDGRPA